MPDFDWSRFAVRIDIKVPIEKLYWCWAIREGIEYWFLRMSEYKSPEYCRWRIIDKVRYCSKK